MLAPKRQKYRKQFRGIFRKMAVKGGVMQNGQYGIKANHSGWIKDREIEAIRVILARATRKVGKFWIRIFPDKPFTKKPAEVTMGAGKGDVAYFVASVSAGRILFEIDGIGVEEAKQVYKNINAKLSVKSRLVIKEQ